MSIVVECPHCETRFNLQPDMVGKSMRCPNIDCRQVFTVQEKKAGSPKPAKPAAGRNPTGDVADFVEVVEAEPARPAAKPTKPARPLKPAKSAPVEDVEVVAEEVDGPKEVVWTGDDVPPPPPPRTPARPAVVREEPAYDEDDEPVFVRPRRKKKKNQAAVILIGMMIVVVVLAGAIGLYVVATNAKQEEQLAEAALKQYEGGDFSGAAKSYEDLQARYGDSDNAPKYKFLGELAALRQSIASVTNRDDPEPSRKKFEAFVTAHKENPLAKPDANGKQVFDAGKKVVEDMVSYVQERVKAYKADRSKSDELAKAEKMIASARELIPLVDSFRPPDATAIKKPREELDAAETTVKFERNRTAVLASLRPKLETPTDEAIQQALALLNENGLADDKEGAELIAGAKTKLRELVKYTPDPAGPQAPPASAAPSLLFVAPVAIAGKADPGTPPEEGKSAVFLALGRGVLYAMDEGGNLLWAARVGADVTDPPSVAKVDLDDGPNELAVVVSNVAGQPALSGHVLRTGKARWYQPLPAPPAGPAVVVGTRAYVSLRDPQGSVFEFDLTSGQRVGKIVLGQPVGPAAVARPGTGLVYVPAEARRVYVLEVDAKDDDGNRIVPRCVQVIATNHAAGTLRTAPLIIGPEGRDPGDRFLILAQSDGPNSMKLRPFKLPDVQPASPDGSLPPESPIVGEAELPLPGWATFPPTTDGERLAVVTDLGQFRLFGVNQPGNLDRPVFPFPNLNLPTPAEGLPVPGLVIPAEEAAFWVLANGTLQKFRVGLNPVKGLEVMPVGAGVPLGVPTQPVQLNPRRDTAFFVVRSANSSGCRAVAVNRFTGAYRWERQLGVLPAAGPLPTGDGNTLFIDEDGGAVLLPPTAADVPAGQAKAAAAEWAVASAPDSVNGAAAVAASADGKTVFAVIPVAGGPGTKLVVRKFVAGKPVHTGTVTAQGPLAGPPAVLGDSLLLPIRDGFVYRHVPGDMKLKPDALAPGPRWWEDRRNPDAPGFVAALSDETFVTTDGGRVLTKWNWPGGRPWSPGGTTWEVRERVATPPLLLPPTGAGSPPRMLVGDITGSVWLYAADRAGPPTRRWRPGANNPVPVGRPTTPFVPQPAANGRLVVAYVVEGRHLVSIDPDRETPLWVARTADDVGGVLVGSPQPAGDGRWLVTDLVGRVAVFDGETGKPALSGEVGLPGAVPAAAGGFVGKSRVVVPLSDGSAAVVVFPEAAPEPKGDGKP